jgi:hypothetical protein
MPSKDCEGVPSPITAAGHVPDIPHTRSVFVVHNPTHPRASYTKKTLVFEYVIEIMYFKIFNFFI